MSVFFFFCFHLSAFNNERIMTQTTMPANHEKNYNRITTTTIKQIVGQNTQKQQREKNTTTEN